jgi:hypothetical protein
MNFKISINAEIEFTSVNIGDNRILYSNHNIQNAILEHAGQT